MADFFANLFGFFGKACPLKKAQKFILLGKETEALELLGGLLKKEPGNVDALLWAAVARLGTGEYDDAISLCDRAAAISPSNPFWKMLKGEALLHLERYEESISILTESLEANPDNTRITYLIGVNYVRTGKMEKASSFFETAIRYDRELVDSRLLAMAEHYLHKNCR